MFKNYLKTAWRNLKRRKVFSFINLFGLAAGMAVCLMLGLYIQSELGYDNFQEKGKRYRLAVKALYPGRTSYLGEIPQSIGQVVKLNFLSVGKRKNHTGR